MNIFFLHVNPKLCAKFHCDKHCVKMILEICQMLWTAVHIHGVQGWQSTVPYTVKVYKPTHKNHPMNVWVRSSLRNFYWSVCLGLELCKEYTDRYHKTHACEKMLRWFRKKYTTLVNLPGTLCLHTPSVPKGCTTPPLCMPDEFKTSDVVQSYRNYYCGPDKSSFAKWKSGDVPEWFPTS